MRATYCRRWNFDRHTPIDPLTANEAIDLDAAGELYSVALGDPSAPDVVIEVNWRNSWLGVWFFEPAMRQSLNYGFRKHSADLFLEEVVRWKYPDDQVRTLSGAILTETFSYQPDGNAKRVADDDGAQERLTQERSGVDVTDHWEPVPEFGEWASVTRYDRSKPVPTDEHG